MSATRTSLRLSAAGLRAHKRRFAGTFVAVMLGVAFLSGTLVMGDTLRGAFDTMFSDAASGTDAVVRGADAISVGDEQPVRRPVDAGLAEELGGVPGVAAAVPDIQGTGRLLGADGEPLGGGGPPTTAGNWIADPELNPYRLAEGRAPERSGEIVINRGAAEDGGLAVGDRTTLLTPDPVRVTVTGIATFAGENGMGQVTFAGLTRADAERYLTAEPGQAETILVRAGPGTSQAELVAALRAALPAGVEAITGEEFAEENMDEIAGMFLSGFTMGLTGFAVVALLVAAFSIYNTFAIIVAQRTRENALLRAIGATRRQVAGQALAEAVAVGVLAAGAGLLGGLAIAAGLQALFPAVGFPFPDGSLVVGGTALGLSFGVGLVVCVGSALLPALRAGRLAPLAALRETAVDTAGASRARGAIGAALGAGGVLLTAYGATAGPSVAWTITGAVATLIAFVTLGPVAGTLALGGLGGLGGARRGGATRRRPARPGAASDESAAHGPGVTADMPTAARRGAAAQAAEAAAGLWEAAHGARRRAPARAARWLGASLARRNALRSPKRTAATATALMIGVAVVSLFTVFGASLRTSLDESVSRSFAGDVAVRAPGFATEGADLSPGLAPAIARLPQVETALGLGTGVAEVNGKGFRLTVTDPGAMGGVLDLGRVEGRLDGLGPDGLAVSADEAGAHGWAVGDTARLAFTDGEAPAFTVRAVYEQDDLAGGYVISREAWAPHTRQDADTLVAVAFADGVTEEEGRAAVAGVAREFGSPEVQTREEFAASAGAGVDMMLTLVYALLGLAVLIALLGIANTLTLAVHERTRELGLLRAVGQTRRQMRAMVRWESVMVAGFGTAGGMALGGFLGWALVRATDSAGTGAFTVPLVPLAVVALVGLAAGALAGWRPARRAARLDVLRAIAQE
jgi:putative ABC transport system permease protein